MRFHHIEENRTITGFCSIDNSTVSIDISYSSIPDNYFSTERIFHKAKNLCDYITEGKCNKCKDCPIYLAADKSYTKAVEGKY